jgi:RNA polymerase sigma-70 factor (ECF subfamily)
MRDDFRATNSAELVRQYGAAVWRMVCRLAGDGDARRGSDAWDCFQDVFVTALEVGRREKVRNWEAMLRRIAMRKALDVLRRRIRERGRFERDVEWEEVVGGCDPVEQSLERAELVRDLRAALAKLPDDQAEAFCLRHIEGMSYEKVGEQLGITGNAAGVVLHRARQRLRELMNVTRDEVRHE